MKEEMKHQIVLIVAAISLVIGSSHATALASTTLYSTMGPEYTSSLGGTMLGGPIRSGVVHTLAHPFSFTGSQSYTLDTVEVLACSSVLDSGYEADFLLMTDDAGKPGTVIESFAFTGPFAAATDPDQLLVETSALHPVLEPDTTYWIAGTGPVDSKVSWRFAPIELWMGTWTPSATWSNIPGDPWDIGAQKPPQAYRITGSPVATVPVPGALLLGMIGAGLVGIVRNRRSLVQR